MTILFWIVWDSNLKLVIHMFGMVIGHIWFQSSSKGLDGYLYLTHLISVWTIEFATQSLKPQE